MRPPRTRSHHERLPSRLTFPREIRACPVRRQGTFSGTIISCIDWQERMQASFATLTVGDLRADFTDFDPTDLDGATSLDEWMPEDFMAILAIVPEDSMDDENGEDRESVISALRAMIVE